MITVNDALREIADLAQHMEDTRAYGARSRVRDGVIGMQQAIEAFGAATTGVARIETALWANEAYLLMSSALPDTGCDEQTTGWATANQIRNLFGGPSLWKVRVRLEFGPRAPDSTLHNPDAEYLRALVALAGMTQREVADRIGVSERMMRYYLSPTAAEFRPMPYAIQFALEALAKNIK